MTTTEFEAPSDYIPAGARFDGAGPVGVEALFAAADGAGAGWSVYCQEEASWASLEGCVHRRMVDGQIVWGLLVTVGVDIVLDRVALLRIRAAPAWRRVVGPRRPRVVQATPRRSRALDCAWPDGRAPVGLI